MKVKTGIYLDDSILEELKVLADTEDRSVNYLIVEAIKKYIESKK